MDRFKAEEVSIYNVFSSKGRNFNIPIYQRPYSWELEYCQKLWDDIKNFYFTEEPHKKQDDPNCRYFLGPVVLFESNPTTRQKEIIDGQQRFTTLSLLLKSFYDVLNAKTDRNDHTDPAAKASNEALEFLEQCLWKWSFSEEKDTDCFDINQPVLSSDVADDKTYEIFRNIMTATAPKTFGKITKQSTTYERNYSHFAQLIKDEFSEGGDLCKVSLARYIKVILMKCSVLFIDCSDQNAALKIFDTLNNRGMQLRDADILKAQIFNEIKNDSKGIETFRENWEIFSQLAKGFTLAKQTSQYDPLTDIFRQLMGVRKAEKNISANDIALRTFFESSSEELGNGKELIVIETLSDKLIPLAAFWCKVSQECTLPEAYYELSEKAQQKLNEISGAFTDEIVKYLQVLSCISINAYWRYLLSVFFMKNYDEFVKENNEEFVPKFEGFLKKTIAFSLNALLTITSDAYKKSVYKKICDYYQTGILAIDHKELATLNNPSFKMDARECSRELNRALLLLHAYLNENQKDLIPVNAQIEHIFPRSWAKDLSGADRIKGIYGVNDDDMQNLLYEKFGNKVMLEAAVNNAARDKYYDFKAAIYHGMIPPSYKGTVSRKEDGSLSIAELTKTDKRKCRPESEIADIHDIWNEQVWGKEQIEKREQEFNDRILKFFKDCCSK